MALIVAVALLATAFHTRAGETRVDALLREADEVRSSEPKRADTLIEELRQLRPSMSSRQREHLRYLSNYRAVIMGRYEEAVGDSIALYDQTSEVDLKYRAALLIANTSALTRDFLLGMRYLERALALQPQVADKKQRHLGAMVAGTLYNEFGQYSLALDHSERLLSQSPDARSRCFARQNRVQALEGLGLQILEGPDIHDAVSDCLDQREVIPASLIQLTLARRWIKEGKSRQALSLLKAALPYVKSAHYPLLEGEFLSTIAQIELLLGDPEVAVEHAKAVLAIKVKDDRWRPLITAHHVLYQVAEARGDTATALAHFKAHARADKAYLDDVRAREYAFQVSQHELASKNQSIQLLSNQNQVLRLQQEVAKRSAWNFRLAIALLLVITASAAYWGWRARRMHRNLHQLANSDSLTGLSNRRHFRARSEAILAQCGQRQRPVSVLLFDLDHFKQINDQCGHSAGDWVLREVARVGRQHCREGDLYGRIGGEEFAMTLVDCDMDAALRIAEQCRRSIEAIDPAAGGCSLPVAASVGVVSTSISGYEYETLIAHADAAMYRSKVAGRNRVSLYEPPPVPDPAHPVSLDSRNADAMLREY